MVNSFAPIYVLRTDYKAKIRDAKGGWELNQPTAEQLSKEPKVDKRTNTPVVDFYRELKWGDSKFMDWMLKLGALYAVHCGDEEMKANPTRYLLAGFPTGYRLFEHIKSREALPADSSSSLLGKRGHSGGGHDRQDAYLYGYPDGRKKRFRSPAEFFHHLRYLCDVEATDRECCACRFCTPDDLQPKGVKQGRRRAASEAGGKGKRSDNVQAVVPLKPQKAVAAADAAVGEQLVQNIAPPPGPSLASSQTGLLPISTTDPQWIPAPAHPSHLLEHLDPVTVSWLQQSSPEDYRAYVAWEQAYEAQRPEAERMHRNIIDKLDHIVVRVGAKIPNYWPRRTVRVQSRVQTQSPLSMGLAQNQIGQGYVQPRIHTPQQVRQHTPLQTQVQVQVEPLTQHQPQPQQQQQQQHQSLYPMHDLHTVLGYDTVDEYPSLTYQQHPQQLQQHAQQLQHQLQHPHHPHLQQPHHQQLQEYETMQGSLQPAYHHLAQQHSGHAALYAPDSPFAAQQQLGYQQPQHAQQQQQQQAQQHLSGYSHQQLQGTGQFGGYDGMPGMDLGLLETFGGGGVDPGLEEAFFDLQGGAGGAGM